MPAPDTVDGHSVRQEFDLLRDAVREAGELALNMWKSGSVDAWDKRDGTPVSEADLAVDRFLSNRLQGIDRGIAWLSEETATDFASRCERPVWIVDPIDGTSAFLKGSKQWCIGACLAIGGRPVAAAAYAAAQNKFYTALAGCGARLNDEVIRVSGRGQLEGSHVIAHESALSPNRWKPPVPTLRRGMTTSLILRHCQVASGAFDAAIAFGMKSDWDLAPGDLIVHEAGGKTANLAGEPFIYNRQETRQAGLVAASPAMLDEITERLHTGR